MAARLSDPLGMLDDQARDVRAGMAFERKLLADQARQIELLPKPHQGKE